MVGSIVSSLHFMILTGKSILATPLGRKPHAFGAFSELTRLQFPLDDVIVSYTKLGVHKLTFIGLVSCGGEGGVYLFKIPFCIKRSKLKHSWKSQSFLETAQFFPKFV